MSKTCIKQLIREYSRGRIPETKFLYVKRDGQADDVANSDTLIVTNLMAPQPLECLSVAKLFCEHYRGRVPGMKFRYGEKDGQADQPPQNVLAIGAAATLETPIFTNAMAPQLPKNSKFGRIPSKQIIDGGVPQIKFRYGTIDGQIVPPIATSQERIFMEPQLHENSPASHVSINKIINGYSRRGISGRNYHYLNCNARELLGNLSAGKIFIKQIICRYSRGREPAMKFRYGKRDGQVAQPVQTSPAARGAGTAATDVTTSDTVVFTNAMAPQLLGDLPAGSIYDFQLPNRLRRKEISVEEMDCINGGGTKDPPPKAKKK